MPQPTEYRKQQLVLHWIIFLLFAVALIAIEWRGTISGDAGKQMRDTLRAVHISAGLLMFILAFVRVEERIRLGIPRTLGDSAWQIGLAHLLHLVLYIVMFALPITGIIFSQAGGRDVAFFGWVLPALIGKDQALRNSVRDIHLFIGNAVYFLVGLHVIASLWHHYFVKDETLSRMVPWLRKRG